MGCHSLLQKSCLGKPHAVIVWREKSCLGKLYAVNMNQSENRRVTTGMRIQGRDDLVKVPTPGASSSTMLVGQRGLRPGWKHIQVLARTAPRSWKPPPFPARVIPTSGGLLHFICRAREPKCQKIKFDHPQVHPVLRVKKAGRTSGC